MSVQLNHTIVSCRDQQRSAAFLTGILALPPATRFGHFLVVQADNEVSLDFSETSGPITPQHYAFLVGEAEFDAAFERLLDQDLPYWADPGRTQSQAINHRDGGRGLYFQDPDGITLEFACWVKEFTATDNQAVPKTASDRRSPVEAVG